MIYKILYAALATTVICSGCSKRIYQSDSLSGAYDGRFEFESAAAESLGGPVTIKFAGADYNSTSNPDYLPAGGQGKFQINGNQASFTDSLMRTANFDGNLVLNGTYSVSTKADSLVLRKVLETGTYTYTVKKQ